MKKIGIAGLQREQIKQAIESAAPGKFECFIQNDMEAASKVKRRTNNKMGQRRQSGLWPFGGTC